MQNGTQTALGKKLKEKVEAERFKTEQIFKESLQLLSKNLQESSKNELHTIEHAIQTKAEQATTNLHHHYKILSIAYGTHWIRTTLITTAAILGITLASWLLLKGISYHLHTQLTTLAEVQNRIEEQQETLNHLKTKTFGLYLRQSKNGRFIVIPNHLTIGTNWTYDNRKAIKLINK